MVATFMLTTAAWFARRLQRAAAVAAVTGICLAAVLPAVSVASWGHDREAILPEFDKCRFLSAAVSAEPREPLAPERLEALYALLEQTGIGALVASHLRRYQAEGVGPSVMPLQFYEVQRQGGPAAAYFETGQLHLSSALLGGLDAEDQQARNRMFTAASFLVHEGIHAIAHHLYLTGRFPIYRSDVKVNEALAYFVQGLYLDEVREVEPEYREFEAVPAWDVCTAQIVRILGRLGITRDTRLDEVYDLLAEMQLESDDATAVRVARLWQYYQFIADSKEPEGLWALAEAEPRPFAVVRSLTRMIATDVERRHCNFDRTFDFMTNRIILYAHYPDTPPGVPGCQYFVDFVQALREDDETSVVLRKRIDRWLIERRANLPQEELR